MALWFVAVEIKVVWAALNGSTENVWLFSTSTNFNSCRRTRVAIRVSCFTYRHMASPDLCYLSSFKLSFHHPVDHKCSLGPTAAYRRHKNSDHTILVVVFLHRFASVLLTGRVLEFRLTSSPHALQIINALG